MLRHFDGLSLRSRVICALYQLEAYSKDFHCKTKKLARATAYRPHFTGENY